MVAFASLSAIFFSALALVQAAPIAPKAADSAVDIVERIVPVSKCTTVKTGHLQTTNGHKLSLSSKKILQFGGSLEVEFQSCQPNFSHYDGSNGLTGGHIKVKSTGKCLSAVPTSEGSSGGPPFTFTTADCYTSDDSGVVFQNFLLQSDNKIFYIGTTQADGSSKFWGDECGSGTYGVSSSQTSGTAKFSCQVQAHHVGLTVV